MHNTCLAWATGHLVKQLKQHILDIGLKFEMEIFKTVSKLIVPNEKMMARKMVSIGRPYSLDICQVIAFTKIYSERNIACLIFINTCKGQKI